MAEALDGFIASVERVLRERRRAEAQVQALAAITSWNAGAERMYGYTRDEAVGQPISFLVPPQLHEELESILDGLKKPADTVIRHGMTETDTPFLEKPYLPNDLAKKIREVMDEHSRHSLAETRRGM